MFKFPASSFWKTIFVRLVVTYLVVILPVILLGVYLYNWSYNNASQDLSRATMSQLSDYLGDLSREIDWMEIQQFDLLEDSDLNRLAVTWDMMDNVERRTSMNYLVHRLMTLESSSTYIKDVAVHIDSIGKTVSASNAAHDFDAVSYDFFRSIPYKKENRLINRNNTLHLSVAKQSGMKGEKPLFIVQIELDTLKLKESLRQVNMFPESRSFLLSSTSAFTLGSDAESDGIRPRYLQAVMETNEMTPQLTVNDKEYHIDMVHSDELNLTVATYLPEETVKRPLNKFKQWGWLFAITSLSAVLVYSFSTYRFVHKPLLLLVQSFRRMEGGVLDIQIAHEQKDEFGYLYNRFNLMLTKLQALIDQDFKQKLMMQKAELKQLQSQINPHFLYNSFFILTSLARTGDLERIERFTIMLGEYFRFITRNGEDNVKLAEEIKHSRMYTEIQNLRFSRRIRVQFDELPKEMEDIRVPRLIIQPLLENAYEHSLEKIAEDGKLRVSFESEPAESRIIVEDNGEMIETEINALRERLANANEAHEVTGMINIHRRIVLIYGEGSGLILSRSELNGLKVTVRIRQEDGHV